LDLIAGISMNKSFAKVQGTHFLSAMGVLCVAVVLFGCSKSNRMRVFGTVTWKGQPVPCGVIQFSPDSSKPGVKGPTGFAFIVDGKYDSSATASKGCMPGPHIVSISGADGKNRSRSRKYGSPLFASHVIKQEIPANGGEFNFVVPDDIKPAPAPSADPE
jgi:hypothetical protein